MPELRRFFETYQRPNYTGTIDELIDAIMRAFFEANDGGAFVIMSDSVSGLDNPLHNWLSAVASAQAQNLNPNSNNQIRIWVIACNI
jgi:hypothetical protein